MTHSLSSWSGGKDSCFALMQAIALGYRPRVLLNMLREDGSRSRSHGLLPLVLEAQGRALGLPVVFGVATWQSYEQEFIALLVQLRERYQLTAAIFGDIDLQEHRDWEEKVCAQAQLQAILPLWQQPRRELVLQMIALGIRARIVSCNAQMGERFLGRILDADTVAELEALGVDPCGEAGEFHTVVENCPLFAQPVPLLHVANAEHDGYWFAEMQLMPNMP